MRTDLKNGLLRPTTQLNSFSKNAPSFSLNGGYLMRSFSLLALVLLSSLNPWLSSHADAALSWDARARLLGGFPPATNEADAQRIARSPEWQMAAQDSMAAVWTRSELPYFGNTRRNLFSAESQANIRNFIPRAFGRAHQETQGLIYLFGGADVLFPALFFPNLNRLLLVGLETPGNMPDPEMIGSGELRQYMSQIRNSFSNLMTNSYFITTRMQAEFSRYGTSTMIAVGLVASGFQITNVNYISIDSRGEVSSRGNGIPGVQVQFRKPNGQTGEVVYLQQDLSDGAIGGRPGFAQYIQNNNFNTALYKAASYVPHLGNFSRVNSLVISKVNTIIQNDDGLPLRAFAAEAPYWALRTYGIYSRPDRMFGVGVQENLRTLYAAGVCLWGSDSQISTWGYLWNGADPCDQARRPYSFRSVSWNGALPFHYGYSAISGPDLSASFDDKRVLGLLMVFDRVR